MEPAVRFENVGKRYVKYDDIPLLLTRALRFTTGRRRSKLWALRHVDLDVQPGESIGVIGRNGSGKSTMLRMLAGVTAPTEGRIRVRGRVAPLLSVGVGFHRELTGRENVYVNGVILGLGKKQLDGLIDSIIAFAEIDEFIDTPVKFYSSGMFVRLGFAVAVAADPEVLLVDEVLAVGDVAFQRKCFDRMEEIRRNGSTVLVVSHNMNAIRRLCNRAMVLRSGEVLYTGDTDEAISHYHESMGKVGGPGGEERPMVSVTDFTMTDAGGKPTAHFDHGEEMLFGITARFSEASEHPVVLLQIHTDAGQLVYGEVTVNAEPTPVQAGGSVRWNVRMRAMLPARTYTAEALVGTRPDVDAPKAGSRSIPFYVSGRPYVLGAADLSGSFEAIASPPNEATAAAREQLDPT